MQFYSAVFLNIVIWLWPFTHGPLPAFWPDFVAICAMVLLVAVIIGKTAETSKVVAMGWLVAACISAAIGILQYLGLGDAWQPFVVNAAPGTALGNTRQTNHLATFLAVGLVALYWLRTRYDFKWLAPACAALLTIALAATSSRTGAVQLIFLLALAIYWSKKNRRQAFAMSGFVIAIYLLASVLLPWALKANVGTNGLDVIQRFGDTSVLCSSRKVLWGDVVDLIAMKPWWGWGWGELNYAHYEALLDSPRFCDKLGHAHNFFLQIAVDKGLPIAMVVFSVFVFFLFHKKPWRESNPDRQWLWAIFGLLFLHSMLEYPLWFSNFQSLLVLAILAFVSTSHPDTSSGGAKLRLRSTHRQGLGVVVVFFCIAGYVGWDYFKVSQLYTPTSQRPEMFRTDTFAKVGRSFIFNSQVIFAQVVTTDLTAENAESMLAASTLSLHLSAEPRIIEKVIESAVMLGRDDTAKWHMQRYQRAYPADYKRWQIVKSSEIKR